MLIIILAMDRNQLNEILAWCGTPYGHRQRCKGMKVDCLQLTRSVLQILRIKTTDIKDYPKHPRKGLLLPWLAENGFEEVEDDWKAGDLFVVSILGVPYHTAVYIGNDTLIDCNEAQGTRTLLLDSSKSWAKVITHWRHI